MIHPSHLKAEDVGRTVIYTSDHGTEELGTLTSWNSLYVFVKFKGPNGEACHPKKVRFLDESACPIPPLPNTKCVLPEAEMISRCEMIGGPEDGKILSIDSKTVKFRFPIPTGSQLSGGTVEMNANGEMEIRPVPIRNAVYVRTGPDHFRYERTEK